MKSTLSLISFLVFQTCLSSGTWPINRNDSLWNPSTTNQKKLKKAYFAGGCFWCVEAIYESIEGVHEVFSGYSGGETKNPNYNQICTGKTGHAETVEILYDPKIVSFGTLVKVFFGSHDPTTFFRQGPDRGSQYRSIAFYTNINERKIIQQYVVLLVEKEIFSNKIVTEVKALEKFYYAEEYHQNFERLNPNNPYVKNVSIPRLRKFKKAYPELLKN